MRPTTGAGEPAGGEELAGYASDDSTEPAVASASTTIRAVSLLCTLADAENGSSVRSLAQTTGMSRSATHRTLQVLAEEGFVRKDEETSRYVVGHRLVQLAARVLSGSTLVSMADEVMTRLVAETGETSYLAMFVPNERFSTFVHKVECSKPLRYVVPVGMRLPLHRGAAGKAILAACSQLSRDELDLAEYTSVPPNAMPRLREELKTIIANGYATSIEEQLEGAAGVAAPVRTSKYVVGAMTLTVPVSRIPAGGLDELGPAIRSYAGELSALLESSPARVHVGR